MQYKLAVHPNTYSTRLLLEPVATDSRVASPLHRPPASSKFPDGARGVYRWRMQR